ncbi:hypothetical protein [Mucilaginibacter sp.]|nr:hypothetical protein [Mucilaginibacter sp.]MDB4920310.1 hypothetical protein [Mucilaginibacter sp.]
MKVVDFTYDFDDKEESKIKQILLDQFLKGYDETDSVYDDL